MRGSRCTLVPGNPIVSDMSSYGAKAVSEVKVPPLLQNQHNLYEELVSIHIKYKIL